MDQLDTANEVLKEELEQAKRDHSTKIEQHLEQRAAALRELEVLLRIYTHYPKELVRIIDVLTS